jgi:tetrahydromethanopterin S-methyltransferase subunit F
MPDETFRWVVAGGVAIATLSIFVMAAMMIVLFRVVSRLQSRVDSVADRTEPVVDSIRHLINENAPRVGGIMTAAQETAVNTRDISAIAKDQAHRFAEVGRDITDRAKAQVARVDAAVDETVDQVQHLGSDVKFAVMKPVTEVSGVLAGIRAGVSAYAQGRRPNVARATQDEEMFI